MIVADEMLAAAFFFMDEDVPPVLADIVEGAGFSVLVPCTQNGLTANFTGDPISGVGDLRRETGNEPCLRPDTLPLLVHEFFGRVAVPCQRCIANLRFGLLFQVHQTDIQLSFPHVNK